MSNITAIRLLLSVFQFLCISALTSAQQSTRLNAPPRLSVVVPPLDSKEHMSTPGDTPPKLPIADTPFFEHVRRDLTSREQAIVAELSGEETFAEFPNATTSQISQGGYQWVGTTGGIYYKRPADDQFKQHPTYGVDGPPANVISGPSHNLLDKVGQPVLELSLAQVFLRKKTGL